MPPKSDKPVPRLKHYKIDPAKIGDAIARRRKEMGLSMQELSDRAGVSPATVLKLEHGEISVQVDKFIAILDQLALPVADLLIFGSSTPETQPAVHDPSAAKLLKLMDEGKLEEALVVLTQEILKRKNRTR